MIHIYIKNSHIYYNSYTSAFYWSWFFPCGLEKKERNGKQLQFTTDCLQQADSEVGVSVPVLQMKKLRLQERVALGHKVEELGFGFRSLLTPNLCLFLFSYTSVLLTDSTSNVFS